MTTAEEMYMPDEWTATTMELLVSVSTDSDLYIDKETVLSILLGCHHL